MRGNIENSYIRNIDNNSNPAESNEVGDIGFEAENAVVDLFQHEIPDLDARHTTPEEDRGFTGFDSGKTIDSVIYYESKPAAGLQITTATDSKARLKKLEELKAKPFLRLQEMKPNDISIPRVLVFVEAKEVASYLKDKDWAKHPKLLTQILGSFENSLKFSLLQTKNPKEQQLINGILGALLAKKSEGKGMDKRVH